MRNALVVQNGHPALSLFDELDELLSSGFSRSLSGTGFPQMDVDIAETDTAYTIHADLPGLKKEDIKVSVEDGVLSITGEKKQETEKKQDRYYLVERRYGQFSRSFSLPANVTGKDIDAKYKNGVLEVVLKKSEESKPKQIEVKIED